MTGKYFHREMNCNKNAGLILGNCNKNVNIEVQTQWVMCKYCALTLHATLGVHTLPRYTFVILGFSKSSSETSPMVYTSYTTLSEL